MPFGIITTAGAFIRFESVGDGPGHHVADDKKVEAKVEGDLIVQAEILGAYRLAVDQTEIDGNNAVVAAPDEIPRLVGHPAPQFAKILLGELFEMYQIRTKVPFATIPCPS